MNRTALEHVIRAASEISGDTEIVVLGGQAVHASNVSLPRAYLSREADLYPRNFPEKSEDIEGAMGELSDCHKAYEYYADGCSPNTATLPDGWQDRLVILQNDNTGGATAYCLSVPDVVLAKYAANREKDIEFNQALIRHGSVSKKVLLQLAKTLPLSDEARDRIANRIKYDFSLVNPGRKLSTTVPAEPTARKPAASMFAGLKLNLGPAASNLAAQSGALSPLVLAVERWAIADRAVAQVAADGLPPVAAQRKDLAEAKAALDNLRPDAEGTLQSALKHDAAARAALTGSIGNQRGAELVACLEREQAAIQDPHVRAARYVATFDATESKAERLLVAATLASDPQAVSVMREQTTELGIKPGSPLAVALQSADVGKALTTIIDPPALGWSR
jgi:hypothetical protein